MSKYNSRVCNNFWGNVIRQDGLVKNLDGTLSVYIDNGLGTIVPSPISKECCEILSNFKDGVYTYNLDEQKCRWSEGTTNNCENNEPYKFILNTRGNDGSLFTNNENEVCSLTIDFDFLIKMDCDALSTIIKPKNAALPIGFDDVIRKQTKEQIDLLNQIEVKRLECENLRNRKLTLEAQLPRSRYSIFCEITPKHYVADEIPQDDIRIKKNNKKDLTIKTNDSDFVKEPFTRTGFGGGLAFYYNRNSSARTRKSHCLTEPFGLDKWKEILGQTRFDDFINGDINSFSCKDFEIISRENDLILNSGKGGNLLIYACDSEFGVKTNLIKDIERLTKLIEECANGLALLNEKYNNTIKEEVVTKFVNCNTPINVLESINATISLDIVGDNGDLTSVYEKNFFPSIGTGNLYQYLLDNNDSGFYICGLPGIGENTIGCKPIDMGFKSKPVLSTNKSDNLNTEKCKTLVTDLRSSLLIESGLKKEKDGVKTFHNSLEPNIFNSNWVNHSMVIEDKKIINKIRNKKIKLSLKINDNCIDFCVLLDRIKLVKECLVTKKESNLISKSPSFDLKRVIDNKKSWDGTKNREFNISNANDTREIRETKYYTENDKLVINTKEIDLDINIGRGIEVDVYNFIGDYPNILKNKGTCDSCDIQPTIEFQNNINFEFQSNEIFDYMSDRCSGDYINFEELVSEDIETVKLNKIKEIVKTELIDTKNRKTINSYATLKSLYERYLNSFNYVGVNSSKFNYMNMEKFAYLLGDYWVDLIEQVVPATTLWGSVKVYTNTVFDQQKFVYKQYSLINCNDDFGTNITASPINFLPPSGVGVEISTVKIIRNIDLFEDFLETIDIGNIVQPNIKEDSLDIIYIDLNSTIKPSKQTIKEDSLDFITMDLTTVKKEVEDISFRRKSMKDIDEVLEIIDIPNVPKNDKPTIVEVDDIDLNIKYQKCNNPVIYQMNSGSEFIGKIKIIR